MKEYFFNILAYQIKQNSSAGCERAPVIWDVALSPASLRVSSSPTSFIPLLRFPFKPEWLLFCMFPLKGVYFLNMIYVIKCGVSHFLLYGSVTISVPGVCISISNDCHHWRWGGMGEFSVSQLFVIDKTSQQVDTPHPPRKKVCCYQGFVKSSSLKLRGRVSSFCCEFSRRLQLICEPAEGRGCCLTTGS